MPENEAYGARSLCTQAHTTPLAVPRGVGYIGAPPVRARGRVMASSCVPWGDQDVNGGSHTGSLAPAGWGGGAPVQTNHEQETTMTTMRRPAPSACTNGQGSSRVYHTKVLNEDYDPVPG